MTHLDDSQLSSVHHRPSQLEGILVLELQVALLKNYVFTIFNIFI